MKRPDKNSEVPSGKVKRKQPEGSTHQVGFSFLLPSPAAAFLKTAGSNLTREKSNSLYILLRFAGNTPVQECPPLFLIQSRWAQKKQKLNKFKKSFRRVTTFS